MYRSSQPLKLVHGHGARTFLVPCVFENHMQVEENLMEMQRFASQNSYPAAIV
jgi:hypothetical protein